MNNKRQIIIWNVPMEANDDSKTQDRVQSFDRIHTKAVRNAIWSPSESAIVSISYDQTCAITDIQTGKLLQLCIINLYIINQLCLINSDPFAQVIAFTDMSTKAPAC